MRSYIPSVYIHTTIKLFWNDLTLQKLCRTELLCVLKTTKILGRALCILIIKANHTQRLARSVLEDSHEGPAVCQHWRHANYSTSSLWHSWTCCSLNKERVFSQYGLTGCRELMEGLLKQALTGSSTSMFMQINSSSVIFEQLSLVGYIAINIF